SGRRLRKLRTRERVYGMAYDPLREVLAIRTLHRVELLDGQTLESIARWPTPAGLPLLAFSPDGSFLALGGKAEILVIELAIARCLVLPVLGARVLSLAFHPSGGRIVAGCSDGIVRFWNVLPI